jgi:hypothetical protein
MEFDRAEIMGQESVVSLSPDLVEKFRQEEERGGRQYSEIYQTTAVEDIAVDQDQAKQDSLAVDYLCDPRFDQGEDLVEKIAGDDDNRREGLIKILSTKGESGKSGILATLGSFKDKERRSEAIRLWGESLGTIDDRSSDIYFWAAETSLGLELNKDNHFTLDERLVEKLSKDPKKEKALAAALSYCTLSSNIQLERAQKLIRHLTNQRVIGKMIKFWDQRLAQGPKETGVFGKDFYKTLKSYLSALEHKPKIIPAKLAEEGKINKFIVGPFVEKSGKVEIVLTWGQVDRHEELFNHAGGEERALAGGRVVGGGELLVSRGGDDQSRVKVAFSGQSVKYGRFNHVLIGHYETEIKEALAATLNVEPGQIELEY